MMAPQDLRYKVMMALEKTFDKAGEADAFLRAHAGTDSIDLIPDKACTRLLTMLKRPQYKPKPKKLRTKKSEPLPKPPKTGSISVPGHKHVMRWAKEFDFRGLDVIFVGEGFFALGKEDIGRVHDVSFKNTKNFRESFTGTRVYAILYRAPCTYTLYPGGIMATICQRYTGLGLKRGYTWHPVPPGPIPQGKGWNPYDGSWVQLSLQNHSKKPRRKKKPESKKDRLPPGPKPERFKIDIPFEEAVKKALRTKPPTRKRESQSG